MSTTAQHSNRPISALHGGVALALILLIGALLRLPGLSWLPSAGGDEGNWAVFASQAYRGETVEMEPAYRGSSPAFAYVLGASMRVLGPNTFAMRFPNVLVALLGSLLAFLMLSKAGQRGAGLVIAAVLAVHPWSVMWSRNAATPYELALVFITLSMLAFWLALERRSPWYVAASIAGMTISAHWSPLAAVFLPGCLAMACLRPNRWLLRHPVSLVTAAVGALSLVPLARAMMSTPVNEQRQFFDSFAMQLLSFTHMIVTAIIGEATVRHFSMASPHVAISGVLGLAAFVALVQATLASRERSSLASFGLVLLGSAIVFMPLTLVGARTWYLFDIAMERWLFVLLPGLSFCLAGVYEGAAGWRVRLVPAFIVVLLVASLRILWQLGFGHGVFTNLEAFSGGESYYMWLTTRDHKSPAAIVTREAKRTKASLIVVDGYPFHILRHTLKDTGIGFVQYKDAATWRAHVGGTLFVLWSPEMRGSTKASMAAYRQRQRVLHDRRSSGSKLVRKVVQPDGFPLLEIWLTKRLPPKKTGR